MSIPPIVHSEWSKAHAEPWRVVLKSGEIREVLVTPDDCHDPECDTCGGDPAKLGWTGKAGDLEVYSDGGQRNVVLHACAHAEWPVREIVAPGEETQREQCARLCEERAVMERVRSRQAWAGGESSFEDIHDNRERALLEAADAIRRGEQ